MKKIIALLLGLALVSFSHAQKYGATPEDSLECIKNLSIYQEFYKQKNYKNAYPAWKQVLNLCPKTSLNTYIKGNVILKNMIAASKDRTAQLALIEELFQLWDLRIEHYGRPGYCKGMKAMDMRTYRPDMLKEAYALYLEAIDAPEKQQGYYPIPFYYFQAVIDMYKAKLLGKEDILAAYEKVADMMEQQQSYFPNDAKIGETMKAVDQAFEPYASCGDLVDLYTKNFSKNVNNSAYLRKASMLLDARNCTDNDIYFKMVEALHKLEPSPESAYLMGRLCSAKKDYAMVVSYLKDEAVNLEGDKEKVNAYMMLANSYLSLGKYPEGKQACMDALNINPNCGQAYILIGYLYAASAKMCGSGDPISDKSVYWVAVDKFMKAKSVDPSVQEIADKAISTYRIHFPTGDELFTYGYNEGDSYTIKCWFVETTTMRASK